MTKSEFNIFDWGGRRTIWLDSTRIEECLRYYRAHRLDGIGINPLQGYQLLDLGFLHHNTDIKGLVIVPSTADIDISAISCATGLRYLSISDNNQPRDLGCFPNLEEFRGVWHSRLVISEHPKLRVLHLAKYTGSKDDLSGFPDLPSLEELGLVQAKISSLTGLSRLSRIRRLELDYIRNLRSIHPVEELPMLETFICQACRRLTDHARIATSQTLRVLRYNDCGTIPGLAFLDRMPTLEEFRFVGTNVLDGDLSPLLRLKRVGFFRKKHYSHTPEQVDQILQQRGGSAIPRLSEENHD